jgi:hypothetical protein
MLKIGIIRRFLMDDPLLHFALPPLTAMLDT